MAWKWRGMVENCRAMSRPKLAAWPRSSYAQSWAVERLDIAGIDEPYGITAGPDGALWFTNAGNNSMGRITTAVTPKITGVTPASGAAGTTVTLTGQNLAGATAVAFGGTPATIVSATATQIVTTVPAGAATGRITVTPRPARPPATPASP
jgi:IPT/TIG domain